MFVIAYSMLGFLGVCCWAPRQLVGCSRGRHLGSRWRCAQAGLRQLCSLGRRCVEHSKKKKLKKKTAAALLVHAEPHAAAADT